MSKVVLGSRGSELALAQARLTEKALLLHLPGVQPEVRIINTTGDKRQDLRLTDLSHQTYGAEKIAKGLFTKELEVELLNRGIDLAVHSLKDLPTQLPEGLKLAGVLPRANTADVLVTREGTTLDNLPEGAVIATSSIRRKLQLQRLRPDLQVEDIRGNVPTRLRKLAATAAWHGLLLAAAGLDRLGFDPACGKMTQEGVDYGAEVLPPHLMLPAAGQGAIGLESRADDDPMDEIVSAINHQDTWTCVSAERALLRLLGGGCQSPLGVWTRLEGDLMKMDAILFREQQVFTGSVAGRSDDPQALAVQMKARFQV